MGQHYWPQMIIVVICIVTSVIANVNGTWFTKALIDDYIIPMVETGSNDFTPLLGAMVRVAVFYTIGIIHTLSPSLATQRNNILVFHKYLLAVLRLQQIYPLFERLLKVVN